MNAQKLILNNLDEQLLAAGFTKHPAAGRFNLPKHWDIEWLAASGILSKQGWKRSDCWSLYIQYLQFYTE